MKRRNKVASNVRTVIPRAHAALIFVVESSKASLSLNSTRALAHIIEAGPKLLSDHRTIPIAFTVTTILISSRDHPLSKYSLTQQEVCRNDSDFWLRKLSGSSFRFSDCVKLPAAAKPHKEPKSTPARDTNFQSEQQRAIFLALRIHAFIVRKIPKQANG